jgi:hypothetical protein
MTYELKTELNLELGKWPSAPKSAFEVTLLESHISIKVWPVLGMSLHPKPLVSRKGYQSLRPDLDMEYISISAVIFNTPIG